MMRKLCIITAVAVLMGLLSPFAWDTASAADKAARTVSIFQVSGDVKMTKGTAKEFAAKEGLSLFDGYTVQTGKSASAHLKLDDSSLVKMDQSSKVKVSKLSSNKLSISVLSGSLSVDAAPQKEGDVLEVRAGSSALAVRGTYFVAEFTDEGQGKYTMFEGEGVVDGHKVPAGYVMTVTSEEKTQAGAPQEKKYDLIKFELGERTGKLVLQTILEEPERFVKEKIVEEKDLELTRTLLDSKLTKLKLEEEQQQKEESKEEDGKTVAYYERRPESITKGGGGTKPTPPPGGAAYIARVNTGPDYPSLQEANQNSSGGDTITIIGTGTSAANQIQFSGSVNLTGKDLIIDAGTWFCVDGTISGVGSLTVHTTTSWCYIRSGGSLSLSSSGTPYIQNDGLFQIAAGGTVSAPSGSSITNNATMTLLPGCNLTADNVFHNGSSFIMNVKAGGNVTVTGSITNNGSMAINAGTGGGTLSINEITSTGSATLRVEGNGELSAGTGYDITNNNFYDSTTPITDGDYLRVGTTIQSTTFTWSPAGPGGWYR